MFFILIINIIGKDSMIFMKKQHGFWLSVYLQNLHKNNRSKHTILNYQKDIEHFITWYEWHFFKKIHKATPQEISNYLMELSAPIKVQKQSFLKSFSRQPMPPVKQLSISSKRRCLSSLNNFYEFLIEYFNFKLIKTTPIRKQLHSIRLKDVDINHTKGMDRSQFEKILEIARGRRERLMLKLLFYGGLRLSELTNLWVDDLDTDSATLYLKRKGGKTHKLKIINFYDIHKDFWNYTAYYRIQKGPLFPNEFQLPITTRAMGAHIKRILLRAGQPELSPHSFRKGCATYLYQETKDLLFVRDYLNHSDAKITQAYIET